MKYKGHSTSEIASNEETQAYGIISPKSLVVQWQRYLEALRKYKSFKIFGRVQTSQLFSRNEAGKCQGVTDKSD